MRSIKSILIICFTMYYASLSAQHSQKAQSKIDSLNSLINNKNTHDTVIAISLIDLASCYYLKNPDKAITICKQAENLSEKINYNIGKSSSYGWLGYLLGQKGEVKQALSYHHKNLKIQEGIGDKTEIATCYNNIGLIYRSKGDISGALECYQKSLKLREETGNRKGIASSLSSLGVLYGEQGNVGKQIEYCQRSLKIQEEIGDKHGMAYTLNNIGYVYNSQGNIAQCLENYHKSLKILEEMGDKFGVAINFNNIGRIYDNQGDTALAFEYYRKALKVCEAIGNKKGIGVGLNNIGHAYNSRGDSKRALKYYFKSLDIQIEMGDKYTTAACLNNIGLIYVNQGEISKGLEYYHRSLENFELMQNKKGIAASLINIGIVFSENGQLSRAENYASKSLKISQALGYPGEIENASRILYQVYTKKSNYRKALEMYELYIGMRDSIRNESTQKAVIKQNMKYEYQKKAAADSIRSAEQQKVLDAQITAQEAQLYQEKTFKYSLFGGLALVVLFSLFVMNRLKITRKQKQEIELKNNALQDRNAEIAYQKELVEHKNKEVLDSITYAERIQSAILPPMSLVNEFLPNSFIIYKPKDIVAGDFYWLEVIEDDVYFSAADCTGHGVPGAMMSVMCSNALTKCVQELGLSKPGEILDATNQIIESRFERSEKLVLDGMDLALCKLNLKTNYLEFAGANNPLWIFKNDSDGFGFIETKADKQPIGQYDNRKPYRNHEIQMQKGDALYIFSDGFVDQFGGEKGKKYKSKPFKNLLLSIQNESMAIQQELINAAFETWKGDNVQVDDVCVVGVKV